MNSRREAPHLDRRSPIRHAKPTRQSAAGPGDRISHAEEVAGFFREDCRALRDSLQFEMVVAQYVPRLRDAESPQGIPVGEAVCAGVVAALEAQGDSLAYSILRGVEHIALGDLASRSTEALGRLAKRGVVPKRPFDDVGAARALSAWCVTEGGHDDQYAFFADFEHPNGPGHSFMLFVERERVKHIGLMRPLSELGDDKPFPQSAMKPVEVAAAGELLRDLLERTYGGPLLEDTDDYRVLIAGARARSIAAGEVTASAA